MIRNPKYRALNYGRLKVTANLERGFVGYTYKGECDGREILFHSAGPEVPEEHQSRLWHFCDPVGMTSITNSMMIFGLPECLTCVLGANNMLLKALKKEIKPLVEEFGDA